MVSWNCKHVQHVKIYLPCNFEVNPITHFDRLCKLEKRGMKLKKIIFSSETTGPIATKLLWNDPWMAPFQKCVRWSWLPTKMAAKLKIEKGGMKLRNKSSPLKLLSQSQPNFAEMILGWSPFKIVSVSAVLYPRWPPWLKLEISSNGQNCSIWSQKVPKFELYKHNDELFNIYYDIFHELWTFAYFDRLCKLEKRGGMKFKKNLLLWNYWANLSQTLLKWSLGGPLSKLCPSAPSCIQDGHHD